MLSDIEIAQSATPQRIAHLAAEQLGIPDEALEPYGHYKAKVDLAYLDSLPERPGSKLILVALTGWGAEEDRRRTQQCGFNQHLVKPVDPRGLIELLGALPAEHPGDGPFVKRNVRGRSA